MLTPVGYVFIDFDSKKVTELQNIPEKIRVSSGPTKKARFVELKLWPRPIL